MIIKVFLPLSLAFIMFSLGLGLTINDFKRVIKEPIAFAVGAMNQMVFLPLIALGLAVVMGLSPELQVGVMILAFSPGGVSSNILAKLAGGDVALSVSLTAVVSVLSIMTVPILVGLSVEGFMGAEAPAIDVLGLGISVFMLVTVPVAIGLAIRHFKAESALKLEPISGKVATGLFVVIVIGALASNWQIFVANLPKLGPTVVLLNIVMLALGYGSGRIFNLGPKRATTIAVETGIQNATLGITVGSLIMESASGLPPFSLPSAVYGITMYLVSFPVLFLLAKRNAAQA